MSSPSVPNEASSASAAAPVAKPKSKKRKAIDPALDFFSASFDPLKALLTPGLKPPVPDAKPLPSLLMCKPLLTVDISSFGKPEEPKPERITKLKPVEVPVPNPLATYTTHFKAPQLLTDKPKRTTKHAATILSLQSILSFTTERSAQPTTQQIQQTADQQPNEQTKSASGTSPSAGPMAQLVRWFEARSRVVVTTRSQSDVRSRIAGLIVAFDKHWNMLLIDCDEQYTLVSSQSVSERQRHLTKDVNGNTKRQWRWIECDRRISVPMQRHVGQMLIKGDTIVSVVKHEPDSSNTHSNTLIER